MTWPDLSALDLGCCFARSGATDLTRCIVGLGNFNAAANNTNPPLSLLAGPALKPTVEERWEQLFGCKYLPSDSDPLYVNGVPNARLVSNIPGTHVICMATALHDMNVLQLQLLAGNDCRRRF